MFRLFITISIADTDERQCANEDPDEIYSSAVRPNQGVCYDSLVNSVVPHHEKAWVHSAKTNAGYITCQSNPVQRVKSLGASYSAPSSRRSSVDYRTRGGSVGNASSLKSCTIGTAIYAVHCKLQSERPNSEPNAEMENSERAEHTGNQLRTPSLCGAQGTVTDDIFPPLSDYIADDGNSTQSRNDAEWIVYYRYSQWRALFDTMRRDKALSQQAINLFPPKRLLSAGDDPEVVRERLAAFPRWLSAVTSDKKAVAHPAFRRFLKLDKYAPELTKEIQKDGTSRIPDVSYIGDLLQSSPEFARYRDRVLAHHRGNPAAVLVPLPPLTRLSREYDYPKVGTLDPLYSYEENMREGLSNADVTSFDDHYDDWSAYGSRLAKSNQNHTATNYMQHSSQRLAVMAPSAPRRDISNAYNAEDAEVYSSECYMKAPTPSAPPLYEF